MMEDKAMASSLKKKKKVISLLTPWLISSKGLTALEKCFMPTMSHVILT